MKLFSLQYSARWLVLLSLLFIAAITVYGWFVFEAFGILISGSVFLISLVLVMELYLRLQLSFEEKFKNQKTQQELYQEKLLLRQDFINIQSHLNQTFSGFVSTIDKEFKEQKQRTTKQYSELTASFQAQTQRSNEQYSELTASLQKQFQYSNDQHSGLTSSLEKLQIEQTSLTEKTASLKDQTNLLSSDLQDFAKRHDHQPLIEGLESLCAQYSESKENFQSLMEKLLDILEKDSNNHADYEKIQGSIEGMQKENQNFKEHVVDVLEIMDAYMRASKKHKS